MQKRQKVLFILAVIFLAAIALAEGFFLLYNSPRWRDWTAAVSKTFRRMPPTDQPSANNVFSGNEDIILQETGEELEHIKNQINRLFYEMTSDMASPRPNFRSMRSAHNSRFPFENTRRSPALPMPSEMREDWVKYLQSEIGRIFQMAHESRHNDVLNLIERDWREVEEVSSVNMVDAGTNYTLTVSLPGFERTDINVNLTGRLLTIEAGVEQQQATPYSQTVSSGRFMTRIMLPSDIIGESAQASYENSILKITIQKKPAGNSLARKVTIM